MSRLCIGTYLTVLYKMRAKGCNQKELVGSVMHSRSGNFNEEDNSLISHIKHGDVNPPPDVRQNVNWLGEKDFEDIVDYFKTDIVTLLDPNKTRLVTQGIAYLILNDESINDDTIVNPILKTQKKDILNNLSPIADFLAGVFLYVLQYTDNTNTRAYVDEIDDDFFINMELRAPRNSYKKTSVSREINEDAKRFCLKYEEEIELLPLCQIATAIDPLHNFVREMYNDYNLCDKETRSAILQLKKQPELDLSSSDWIQNALTEYEKLLYEKKLCKRDFLYEGAKYFRRSYERYSAFEIKDNNPRVFKRLIDFQMGDKSLSKSLSKSPSTIGYYISDYLWLKTNEPRKRPQPPMDYMWKYFGLYSAPEEFVTFWMCRFIIDSCEALEEPIKLDPTKNLEHGEEDFESASLGDSEYILNTQEDMYLYALLKLHRLHNKNIKKQTFK